MFWLEVFLGVVVIGTSLDHGVYLGQDDRAVSYNPEFAPGQLIQEVTHSMVLLFLDLSLASR